MWKIDMADNGGKSGVTKSRAKSGGRRKIKILVVSEETNSIHHIETYQLKLQKTIVL